VSGGSYARTAQDSAGLRYTGPWPGKGEPQSPRTNPFLFLSEKVRSRRSCLEIKLDFPLQQPKISSSCPFSYPHCSSSWQTRFKHPRQKMGLREEHSLPLNDPIASKTFSSPLDIYSPGSNRSITRPPFHHPHSAVNSAACPGCQEGQWSPGVHSEECGQQGEGGSPPLLHCPSEASSAVLCPVLGSPVQER